MGGSPGAGVARECRPGRAGRSRGRRRRISRGVGARVMPATSWEPTVNTGSRLVIGSWNTIDTRPPRSSRSGRPFRVRMSSPASNAVPLMTAPGGVSWSSARAVIVLPQPLSPTTPTTSFCGTSKDTFSTARRVPPGLGRSTLRSDTSRRAGVKADLAFEDRVCREGRRRVRSGRQRASRAPLRAAGRPSWRSSNRFDRRQSWRQGSGWGVGYPPR